MQKSELPRRPLTGLYSLTPAAFLLPLQPSALSSVSERSWRHVAPSSQSLSLSQSPPQCGLSVGLTRWSQWIHSSLPWMMLLLPHGLPPWYGPERWRTRIWSPLSHVFEHSDQSPHAAATQSTGHSLLSGQSSVSRSSGHS